MIPLEPDKIPMPFAYEGGRNEIPESGGEVTGAASYAQGFPPVTQQLLSQGGIPPSRKDFNGIFYILSAYAFFAQSGGVYAYDTTVDYVKNCIITHGNQLYICLTNNGPGTSAGAVEPGTNAAYWSTLLAYLLGAADDIGSATNPIYIKDGAFAASDATVGSGTKPVYLNKGTITASGSTVGSGTKPVYMNSGTLTASGSSVGSSTRPVYLSSGTVTQTGTSLAVDITGNAATATKLGTATVGSGTKPIYLSSGTPTASGSTVGSGTKPIYLSSGTLTASGSTVGNENTPVYLKSGVLTACASGMGVSAYKLGTPGYVKFSIGLIIQWGTKNTTGTTAGSDGLYTVTFPISFTSASSYVIMKNAAWSEGGTSAYDNEISVFSKTAQTAKMKLAHNSNNEEWLAVGY